MNSQTCPKTSKVSISLAEVAGIATWMVVFGITLYWLYNGGPQRQEKLGIVVTLFLIYLGCFLAITKDNLFPDKSPYYYLLLAVQLSASLLIIWYIPLEFLPILTIIWVAILPHFFKISTAIVIMILTIGAWSSIFAFHWQYSSAFFQSLLFSTFHFFAILMGYHTQQAEAVSLESQRLAKELQATQHLLAEASKQNERTRIARDLHDLLGHHLTALIINLQVAGHLTEGEAKTKIDQCYSLAKLLLSDVRDAVTTLRENQTLDFSKMIQLMSDQIPKLKIHSNIDTHLNLEEIELAKALLNCIQEAITNSLRHSGASEFWVSVERDASSLKLELFDNGQVHGELSPGNGLNGMRERIEEFNGELHFERVKNALKIVAHIPLSSNLVEA
ncbi:sensor histidine kinase [Aliikangiella coralliicola]|uniref:Sensor histidine kinase n=1 Tax=Aliikangiella coralliicola TaxID=2592383 RepID=A0A545UIG5_9GAMM|nr:histidine kinase [Aliikangiella coralliicola]TQV89250.1 sensor histidine kinase [Aliikangiella coralliicola]